MLTATNTRRGDEDFDDLIQSGRTPERTKGKSPLWAKILLCVGAVILVLSIVALIGSKVILGHISNSIGQPPMLGGAGADGQSLDGPLNVLMVGTDERPGLEGSRADTIMVMHINAAHDAAYLLSIPRDTLVTIPAFPKSGFGGSREKINAAYESGSLNGAGREGGFELLATTIAQVTGLRFNAGAIVNFDGFEAVVNALGGVDMCIDETTTSFDHDVNGNELRDGNAPMVYEQGCRHLLPWQALDFVRQRHSLSSGDYGRQRHQQQFLKAVAKAALSQGLTDPIKLDRVLTATGKALTFDPGRASLTDWIFTLKGLGVDGLTLLNTNGGSFAAVECPDGSSCQMLTPDSEQMFAAAKNDTLPAFIQQHPTWVAKA